MKFRIRLKNDGRDQIISKDYPILFQNKEILVEGDCINCQWKNKEGQDFILLGDLLGHREEGKINTSIKDYSLLEDYKHVSAFEGRFVVIKISNNGDLSVWTDTFSRVDVYWYQDSALNYYITSGKDMIPSNIDLGDIDQNALAQLMTIYGNRPLKKHTLRENLNRLGVNEKISIKNNQFVIDKVGFSPKDTFSKDDQSKLDQYADLFIEAVRARSSNKQNIVFLSSGWDSTSILATLCHLHDGSKIECVIGRMKYSKRSAIINQFELDRAKKMADYYGVNLHIVELDYTENAEEIKNEVSSLFKGQEFSNLTGFNHWLLAKGAAKIAKPGAVVFAGEISDGAHNLGFSQYFSIYHPDSQSFREYSDKMASYLFGPTFLKQLIEDKYSNDPVWNIFMQYNANTKFDKLEGSASKITSQLLETFFLSGGRIPLFSKDNCQLLTPKGRKEFLANGNETYLKMHQNRINENNLYSHYLHLYHSFHWQGGTVATLEHVCDAFGLKCRLPFLDKALIDFLSQMPESWGRGLDINNTKYPLKWMLTNRIDYPMHYQSGPHSYLYDVNPSFSHSDEIVNASSFKTMFKKVLSDDQFLAFFDSEYFDLDYIKGIIDKYTSGESVKGQELVDILNLGNLISIGHLN